MKGFFEAIVSALRRIWNAYTIEAFKAAKLKFTYLGPALVVATVCSATLLHKVTRDDISDYPFIAKTTPLAINLVGAFMLILFCSGLMSKELSSGTIRLVLVRPLRRWEFLAAKLLLGMSYAVLLSALGAATSWGIAGLFGDLEGVTFGGELIYTGAAMARAYLFGLVLGFFPLFAAVAYAVFISGCTRSTGAAVGSAVGIWIVADTVKSFVGLENFVFSTYLETPWQRFADLCDGIDVASWADKTTLLCVATSVVSFAIFTGVAGVILARRDLHA
ncbi:MAG TPA: ABC transporter permease subunit [Candidatus Hydrogenedentes bacterium]|nr:ABC transporter permease subunit [Candidatus Hydrogenedentota bacterium]HIJ72702.1 ABC transporter permease subunit [Candidatus Hydrogenedentota bacterium]